MPCSVYSQRYAAQNLRNALDTLSFRGILPTNPAYAILRKAAGDYSLSIGFKIPKPLTLLLKLFGLSPGTITLWHDADSGFFTEARVKPGAPPIYHHVTDEIAATILKGELTHELEQQLMAPVEYYGE